MRLLYLFIWSPCSAMKYSMDTLKFMCSWKPGGIPGAKVSVKVSSLELVLVAVTLFSLHQTGHV